MKLKLFKGKARKICIMVLCISLLLQMFFSCGDLKVIASEREEYTFKGNRFSVSFVVNSQWENHYSATVTVTNTGNDVIDNWMLSFSSKDEIVNIWNASIVTHKENVYELKNLGWNQDIEIGSSISFGFIASYEEYKQIPDAYTLLGDLITIETDKYSVEFVNQYSSEEEAIVDVTITNISDNAIEDWKMFFTAEFDIISIWNAMIESCFDGSFVIKNCGYNSVIPAGDSVTFGCKISSDSFVVGDLQLSEVSKANDNQDNSGDKKTIINDISISRRNVYVDEKISNRVSVIIDDENLDEKYAVALYEYHEGMWEYLGDFYDAGNLNLHGDEIKNDGIYTNFFDMCGETAGELRYKVSVMGEKEELEYAEFTIEVVECINSADCDNYHRIVQRMQEYVEEKVTGENQDNIDVILSEIESILCYEPVAEIVAIDAWTVKIVLNSGLLLYVQLTDDGDKELMLRGSEQEEATTVINDESTDIKEEEVQSQELCYSISKNILLWAPFDAEWGESDETGIVKEIVGESDALNLTVLRDDLANISSLKTITNYGLIILASHGLEGNWIATGERYSGGCYKEELRQGEMSVLVRGEWSNQQTKVSYLVNSTWFENNIDSQFPNSIIINNSCSSLATDDFWNVFHSLGAETYYGYTGAVTNDYIVFQTGTLLMNLVHSQQSVEEAFSYSYDSQYDGAFLGVRGTGNLALTEEMLNGGFEDTLAGWNVDGDARVVSKLGNIMPTEGDKMAIISTGIGYTKELGEISQKIYIPEDAKQLQFDWNFLSEEFLEYIGSRYDDPFRVCLTMKDDTSRTEVMLLNIDVNKIAEDFDASVNEEGKLTKVSPDIVFDRGDVYMTGWQKSISNISEYAGRNVTLNFSVRDARDTIYTTVVLLDNITFDTGVIEPSSPVNVSDDLSDIAISGKYSPIQSTKGKSYILYQPELYPSQAKQERKRIKYQYGYKKLSQVEMHKVTTEKKFVSVWNAMIPGSGMGKIDTVSLLFHGSYYAIMIKSGTQQNLTTSPDRMVTSDDNATYIRDLKRKKIKAINILTCNGALLDAININDIVAMTVEENGKEKKVDVRIKGNVAQAFLDSQDVNVVTAWDGSLGYTLNRPRLSFTQTRYLDYLKDLAPYRLIEPIRATCYYYADVKQKKMIGDLLPKGRITYQKDANGQMYCKYKYKYVYCMGLTKVYSTKYKKIYLRKW